MPRPKRGGYERTEEHRRRMSEAVRASYADPNRKRNKGRKVSEETRRKLSEAGKRRFSDPKNKEFLYAPKSAAHRKALSKPKSEEHKAALSRSAKRKETQEKRRKTMLERYGVEHPSHLPHSCAFRPEYWELQGLSPEEAEKKVSELQSESSSLREEVVSHWSIDYWTAKGFSEEEARAKVSEIQTANAEKSSVTVSSECTRFLDLLEEESGVRIQREVVLFNRFKVDGFVEEKKVVIEYYGSFWHMHPSLYGPEDVHRVTGWKAESKWAEDQGRVSYLEKAGYRVFVVWDVDDLHSKAKEIAKEIRK